MPGSSPKALAKARTLDADVVILDLEDAVAPSSKASARESVVAEVAKGGYACEVIVRVNGAGTPYYEDDMKAVASVASHIQGVCLPKVESAAALTDARERLARAGGSPASPAFSLPLWAMIETPKGVFNAYETVGRGFSSLKYAGLAGLIAGTSDLTKDLKARHTSDRSPMLFSLSAIVLAARAAGIAALDGVHLDIHNATEFAAHCEQGRSLGFDGKTLIHPSQIEAANRTFGPSDADVALARRIVAAHAEAASRGSGVVLVDGRLVEALHVQEALGTIALHEAIAARARARSAV